MRYRIKICGITSAEQAAMVSAAGADAIGLVFLERSRRAITPQAAADIVAALPPFVATVGLFVDPHPEEVHAALDRVRLDCLQFHGDESPAFCAGFGVPYLRAIAMGDGRTDPRPVMDAHRDARGFLLDSHAAGKMGGTGQAFDWSAIPASLGRPWLLAGGLDPGNVAAALRQTQPYGVDVSSGVECAPGMKDAGLVRQFVRAVREQERE
jgi:phosphoribosylanthranilate isomerase